MDAEESGADPTDEQVFAILRQFGPPREMAMRYGASKAASSLMNSVKTPPVVAPKNEVMPKAKRTIHIRSTWAVGDANGIRQQGSSDHTIEFED